LEQANFKLQNTAEENKKLQDELEELQQQLKTVGN
jgi:peptidoglycan hydrolase CwlO-like protein